MLHVKGLVGTNQGAILASHSYTIVKFVYDISSSLACYSQGVLVEIMTYKIWTIYLQFVDLMTNWAPTQTSVVVKSIYYPQTYLVLKYVFV